MEDKKIYEYLKENEYYCCTRVKKKNGKIAELFINQKSEKWILLEDGEIVDNGE